jgi:uncharacterized protein YceK
MKNFLLLLWAVFTAMLLLGGCATVPAPNGDPTSDCAPVGEAEPIVMTP